MGTTKKFQMGSIPAAFCHAPSAIVGDKFAMHLCLASRTIHGFGHPHSSEFEGKKLQIHCTVFASFLSPDITPHRLDHSKLPQHVSTNPNNNNCVGFKTIVVHFGKVKEIVRQVISHEDLDPDWLGTLHADLTKKLVAFYTMMSCQDKQGHMT